MIDPALGRAGTGATLAACCGAMAATPRRMLRPRRPDQQLLSGIRVAGFPSAKNTVRLRAMTQAEQHAPAAVVAEGARRPLRIRMGMTTFLIEHPRARFLVDPSMCSGVHRTVLPQLPRLLRMAVAPDKPVTGLAEILERNGTSVADIDFALPTHLHWDHVAGLSELPGDVPVQARAVERDWAMSGAVAPWGVARGPLLSANFEAYDLDGPPVLTFENSHDVFNDGSVIIVDLAGHTPGSVGVLLAVEGGSRVLLAGDAVWNRLQISLVRRTAPFPGQLTDADRDMAFETIHRLHALPQDIEVIPSHDHAATSARSAR